GVDFAALLLNDARVLELLEHLQGGVDDARARAVGGASALFDVLDDLVAVSRLLGDGLEHQIANAAAFGAGRWFAHRIRPPGPSTPAARATPAQAAAPAGPPQA